MGIAPSAPILGSFGVEPDLLDGISGGASNPVLFERGGDTGGLLVVGENGLDMNTGITGLPANFQIPFRVSLNAAALGDGIQDVIFSSIATPTGQNIVTFYDASGNIVGNPVSVSFGPVHLYNTRYDQHLPTTSQTLVRDVEMAGLNLEEAGINVANFADVTFMSIQLDTQNEIGIVAVNTVSYTHLTLPTKA